MIKSIRDKIFSNLTTIPEHLQASRLPGLDGLRAVSIILVLLSHIFRGTIFDNYLIGSVGVNTFFVISGFLITTLLLKEKILTGGISLKSFYIRRSLRILPVSYLFIFVLILINLYFKLQITLLSFLTAVLYLKNLPIPNAGEWHTGHFWSISVEEQFYLLFPFLLARNINKYIMVVLGFIILIPLLEAFGYNNAFKLQSNYFIHLVTYFLINLWGKGTICILIGSLFSILTFNKAISFDKVQLPYWFSFVLFIASLMFFSLFHNNYLSPVIFSICIVFIILNNLGQKSLLLCILETRIFVKIGVLSYSIYIWQQIFTFYQPWHISFKYANSILTNLILLAVVSSLSYYCFEKPFLRLKKAFKKV